MSKATPHGNSLLNFKEEKYHRRWRQHRAITVDTVDTVVDTVDNVDTVDTIDTVDTVDTVHTVDTVDTVDVTFEHLLINTPLVHFVWKMILNQRSADEPGDI